MRGARNAMNGISAAGSSGKARRPSISAPSSSVRAAICKRGCWLLGTSSPAAQQRNEADRPPLRGVQRAGPSAGRSGVVTRPASGAHVVDSRRPAAYCRSVRPPEE